MASSTVAMRCLRSSSSSSATTLLGSPLLRRTTCGSGGVAAGSGRRLSSAATAAAASSSSSYASSRLTSAVAQAVDRPVGYWLLGCSGLVAGMVSIGGLTRLTKSGLSMAYWKPTRVMPPVTREEWAVEFENYKQFPEWQQRKSMTLEEFKFIFYWEYGHRMLGRAVGVAFGLPLAYFLARGRIPPHLKGRMFGLFALGGSQGAIGWWMVKSGVDTSEGWVDPKQRKEIRVSPYRLATHLGMAFTTYTLLVWTALDVLNPVANSKKALAALLQTEAGAAAHNAAARAASAVQSSSSSSLSSSAKAAATSGESSAAALRRLAGSVRGASLGTMAVVFTTAMSGAFVAGNDAGRAYNTFPKMDGQWVPDGLWTEIQPAWRNAFENTATVQFDHRVLAFASTAAVGSTVGLARFGAGGALWAALPTATKLALGGMGATLGAQVGLGISTLLLYVPIELAAAHQLGSLVLLSFTTAAAHSLRVVPLQMGIGGIALGSAAAVAVPGMATAAAAYSPSPEFSK